MVFIGTIGMLLIGVTFNSPHSATKMERDRVRGRGCFSKLFNLFCLHLPAPGESVHLLPILTRKRRSSSPAITPH